MRNIILQDWLLEHIDALLSIDDIFISVLIVDVVTEQRLNIIAKYADRIGKVYYRNPLSYEDFFEQNKNDYPISLKEIEKYRKTQLKVEHDFHRVFLDHSEAQYRYLTALAFWLDVFAKTDIDCVISMDLEHGGFYDSICYDIAIEKGINVYIQEVELGSSDNVSAFCFKRINDSMFVNISSIEGLPKLNLDKFIFNRTANNTNSDTKVSFIERYRKSILKKFIDYLKYSKKMNFKKAKKIFYKKTDIFKTYYTKDPEEIFKGSMYLKNLQKVYKKISTEPNLQEKYVYYALHFEPEATILNRGEINNQLFAIKLLSDSLPKGWKLYVKEHPWSFRYVNDYEFYFKGLNYFKTFQFYRNILNLENAELINLDVKSKDLIENSQAVATICGTITIETIFSKKPIIIFSPRTTIFSKVKDTFPIDSKTDITECMEKVKNNFVPEYTNTDEVILNYMLETSVNDTAEKRYEFYSKIFRHLLLINSSPHSHPVEASIS